MNLSLYVAITVLGLASYVIGVWKMLQNKYAPSTFSRVVWVLLAINSFAGVLLSNSSKASILLAAILLIGNAAVCIVSFAKGTREMGHLEYVCLALLIISGVIWIFFKAPLINLSISLIAHFIGAAPTYKKVWRNPKSENTAFWLLFFLASVLSIFVSDHSSLKTIILPIYFIFFDGSIVLLTLRKYSNKLKEK
jgi:cation transport ATPase